MKKIFLFVFAAALAVVACNKSETVKVEDAPSAGQITLKAITSAATKAGELDGTLLTADYGIYTAATQKNAAGLIENASFFSGNECLFACADDPMTAASQWKASPAQYWPIGGVKLDFLAYAQKKAAHEGGASEWVVTWDKASTDVAAQMSFYGVDTYKAPQEDIMYAIANDMTRETISPALSDKAVPMAFNHAQALLIFNVKSNVADKITINEISFVTDERVKDLRQYQNASVAYAAEHAAWAAVKDAHDTWVAKKATDGYDSMDTDAKAAWDAANPEPAVPGVEPTAPVLADLEDDDVTLKTVGDFRVNNERNTLSAGWMFGNDATKADNFKMPAGSARSEANKVGDGFQAYGTAVAYTSDYAQLGETLLIPEQDKVNFTIKYTIGGKTAYYIYNDLRGIWKMGHKYYYNLDLTLDEIVITESVVDFQPNQAGDNIGL